MTPLTVEQLHPVLFYGQPIGVFPVSKKVVDHLDYIHHYLDPDEVTL